MRYLNKSLAIVLLLVVLCLSVITVGAVSVTSGADAKARMMQYAQQTYSVYKHYGFSDIHIAAVLANWQGESLMDPTSIESVFGEPYNINGPKHQAAIASNFDMNVYNPAAAMEVYHGNPPKPSGIGFAGYTAENATALIEYAKSFNKNWWDFDVQVAFSMDATKGYASANWLQTTFKNTNYTDLATAVRAYVEEFERPLCLWSVERLLQMTILIMLNHMMPMVTNFLLLWTRPIFKEVWQNFLMWILIWMFVMSTEMGIFR